MARLKCTFDYEDDTKDILQVKSKKNGVSVGKMLNLLTRVILGSNSELKKVLAEATQKYINWMEEDVRNRFSISNHYRDIEDAKILVNLLTDGKGVSQNYDEKMIRYETDKVAVVIPRDWILVTPSKDFNDCEYVGVVATKNANIFNFVVPVFVFFSKVPINTLADEDIIEINKRCINYCGDFQTVLNNEVVPIYDDNGKMLNSEIYHRSPVVGYFPLYEYSFDVKNPENALVMRKENYNG